MSIQYPIKKSLGADVQSFPKTQQEKIVEIIDAINLIATDGLVVESGSQVGSNTPTINQPSGTITVGSVATAGLATRTITLTNSFITADSKVFVSLGDYGGTGIPLVYQVTPADGSVAIIIYNAHASVALSAAFDLDFLVVN
jgi:hypothetical protein